MINKVSCCNVNTNQYINQNVIPTTTTTKGQTSFGSMREINNTNNLSKFVAGFKSLFNSVNNEASVIKEITGTLQSGGIKAISMDKNGVRDFSRGNELLKMTPATDKTATKLVFGIPDETTGEIAKGKEIEAKYAPGSYLASIFGELEEKLKGLFPKNWN